MDLLLTSDDGSQVSRLRHFASCADEHPTLQPDIQRPSQGARLVRYPAAATESQISSWSSPQTSQSAFLVLHLQVTAHSVVSDDQTGQLPTNVQFAIDTPYDVQPSVGRMSPYPSKCMFPAV